MSGHGDDGRATIVGPNKKVAPVGKVAPAGEVEPIGEVVLGGRLMENVSLIY